MQLPNASSGISVKPFVPLKSKVISADTLFFIDSAILVSISGVISPIATSLYIPALRLAIVEATSSVATSIVVNLSHFAVRFKSPVITYPDSIFVSPSYHPTNVKFSRSGNDGNFKLFPAVTFCVYNGLLLSIPS